MSTDPGTELGTDSGTEFREKVRSLGFPRKMGASERKVEVADGRKVVETTEHWDGRQDATTYPDVVRYGTRHHRTGKRKGRVAEVHEMDRKERRERYGDG
jgi:hypothetical protein